MNKIKGVLLVMLLMVSVCIATTPINSRTTQPNSQLVKLLNDRFSQLDSEWLLLTPTATAPSMSEGKIYYDSGSNTLYLCTGTAWVAIDTAGGVSLDGAYNLGSAITVDGDAITLTSGAGTNNEVLALVQSNVGNYSAFSITNASAYPSIQITTSGSGADITGSSATWSVAKTGVATLVGATIGTSGIVLQNSETISNATDSKFEFDSAAEDMTLDLSQSNIIAITSDTSADTFDFGALDTLTGMTTITGSNAADFTIQTTSDTAGEDLIISQAGSGAYSVIIQSAGTGVDSISIQATKGIDIDSVDDMAITNTASTAADDFVITQTGTFDASLILTSAGTGADAVSLITTDTDGDIKINSADKTDIDSADDITIDLAGAAGEDILVTNTGGSIVITATEAITDAITLDASTAGAGIDITSGEDIDMTTTGAAGEDITLSNAGGSVILSATEDATDAINIDATAGGIDIDAVGESGQDIVITNTGGSITVSATESAVDSVTISSTVGGIDISALGGAATEDIDIVATSSSVNITGGEAAGDAVVISSSNAAGGIDITSGTGDLALVSTDDITLTVATAVTDNITLTNTLGTAANAIGIQASAGGIDIDAVGATAGVIDVLAGNTLTMATTAGAVSITGATTALVTSPATTIGSVTTTASTTIRSGTGDLALTSTDDITLTTNTGTGDAIKLTNTPGTGTDAISLQATAGGIDIDGGSAQDISVTSTGKSIVLTATEAVGDAIVLNSSNAAGGIDILAGTGDVQISSTDAINIAQDSVAQLVTIGNETGASSLNLKAGTGNIDIQGVAATTITIGDAAQTAAITIGASTATMTDLSLGTGVGAHTIHIGDGGTAAQVVTIGSTSTTSAVTVQAGTGKVTMSSAGTGADAFNIDTSAGGIDIDIAGAADGEDFAVNAASSIQLIASQDSVADAIKLQASGTAGGMDLDSGTGGITADSTGVISIDAADDLNLTLTSGTDAEDLTIAVAGTGNSSLLLSSIGTATDAISIQVSGAAGGIDIDGGAGGIVDIQGTDDIIIKTTSGGAGEDVLITQAGANDSGIILEAAGTGTDAIGINASGTAGGISLDTDDGTISIVADGAANGDVTIDSEDDITLISASDLVMTVTGNATISSTLVSAKGIQCTVVTKVAAADGGAGSTILPNTSVVHVTGVTTNADDWILLPAGTIGQRMTIIFDVACEVRTPASSNDTINNVDADGGSAELTVAAGDVIDFYCTATNASWVIDARTNLGAAKTIVPDA